MFDGSHINLDYEWDIISNLTQVSSNQYQSTYQVKAPSQVGNGTLSVEITTPSGQTNTSDTRQILLNTPDPDDFWVEIEELYSGDPVSGSPDGPFEICDDESYLIYLSPSQWLDDHCITDVEFDFDFDYTVLDEGDYYIEIETDDVWDGDGGQIYVSSGTYTHPTFKEMEFEEGCGGYYMMMTPNPTTGETTVSIETSSELATFDETAEWDYVDYSPTQSLKTQKTKLKGKSTKIQTNGWTEGVYTVRAKYKDEVLTGKLVVKK